MEEAWLLDGIIQRSRLIGGIKRKAEETFKSESSIAQRLTVGSGGEKSKRENIDWATEKGDEMWTVDFQIRSMLEIY